MNIAAISFLFEKALLLLLLLSYFLEQEINFVNGVEIVKQS